MMAREEAIAILQEKYDYCKSFYDLAARPKEDYAETAQYLQALQVALTALCPVSREQVEKVFGGKWEEETYTTVSGRGRVIHSKKCTCSACGKANGRTKTNFCPSCGAPMTDEAVEMVMERLEALEDG